MTLACVLITMFIYGSQHISPRHRFFLLVGITTKTTYIREREKQKKSPGIPTDRIVSHFIYKARKTRKTKYKKTPGDAS